MIETGQDLVDAYVTAFKLAGGDPDACVGVQWAKQIVKSDASTSVKFIIRSIGEKIDEGEADHGWLISILKYCWADISEAQRLSIFALLEAGGAHKGLVNRNVFPALTDREKAFLIRSFKRSGSVAAVRRLNG